MVSIVAEEIYNETETFSFTQNDIPANDFADVSYPSASVSSVLNGFTYINELAITTTADGTLDVSNSYSTNRDVKFVGDIEILFGGFEFFLREGHSFESGRPGGNSSGFTLNFERVTNVTADFFLDEPFDINVGPITSDGTRSEISVDETTSFDVTIKVAVLGRQP